MGMGTMTVARPGAWRAGEWGVYQRAYERAWSVMVGSTTSPSSWFGGFNRRTAKVSGRGAKGWRGVHGSGHADGKGHGVPKVVGVGAARALAVVGMWVCRGRGSRGRQRVWGEVAARSWDTGTADCGLACRTLAALHYTPAFTHPGRNTRRRSYPVLLVHPSSRHWYPRTGHGHPLQS